MQILFQWIRRVWLIVAVAAIVIVLDQTTKEWVRVNIPEYTSISPIPALGDYFLFEHVRNYGAAFGILQNQGNVFVVIAIVVAVAILLYARNLDPQQRLLRVLLGMQLGGALGNLVDRLNQGYVTDFVKMGIPNLYYWPNYNIADSSIVVGVIALGVYLVWEDIRRPPLTTGGDKPVDHLPAEHS
ncbi:MAG TPA: signal peptidase II [Caldilineaceae bacterium]|nr:signal peptidase II [Caldilineaceae bacterium]